MKKTILPITVLVFSTLAALAQGTLNYSIRVTGSVVAPVYLDELPPKVGNTTAGFPAGTQTYGGPLLAGSGYSAQLFYAAGLDRPEGSLIAAPGSITTFRTSATFAGTIVPSFLTLPGTTVGGGATLQLRAWDNKGGTITSWAQVELLYSTWFGFPTAGKSPVFNISGLTSSVDPAPPAMTGLRSFNIYPSPEPGTYALLALGGLGFWFCRRSRHKAN